MAAAMFDRWEEYFFMIGSSAAALIGLMFVVVTLTAGRDRRELERGKQLYTSPIVWHLGVVLVLSGAAIAPVMSTKVFGIMAAALGLLGVWIGIRNAIGISRVRMSGADTFDMWWYGIVPALAYVALAAASIPLLSGSTWGVTAAAAALMALLLVSIHAEWDLVTFLAPDAPQATGKKDSEAP
jgi:hypothetical protein